MVASTYEGFTYLYDIPYTVIVILYLLSKYAVLLECICVFCNKKWCHANCSCRCWKGLAKLWRKITSWMVRIIFGGTEGVSEHKTSIKPKNETDDDDHTLESDETEDGIRKVYIRGIQVKGIDLDILGVIILCFSLLLLLTMYSTYLLDSSFSCSEDPAFYCFPHLISNNDPDNPAVDVNERITNCSIWTERSASSKVTFRCFQYAFNGREALVVGGGLLTIFVVSMRTLISIIVNIYEQTNNHKCLRETVRITLLVILVFLNLFLSVIIMVFTLAGTLDSLESEGAPVAQKVATYIAENGVQFVIIMGTVELLLLIHWDHYQDDHQSRKAGKRDKTKKTPDTTELKEVDL